MTAMTRGREPFAIEPLDRRRVKPRRLKRRRRDFNSRTRQNTVRFLSTTFLIFFCPYQTFALFSKSII